MALACEERDERDRANIGLFGQSGIADPSSARVRVNSAPNDRSPERDDGGFGVSLMQTSKMKHDVYTRSKQNPNDRNMISVVNGLSGMKDTKGGYHSIDRTSLTLAPEPQSRGIVIHEDQFPGPKKIVLQEPVPCCETTSEESPKMTMAAHRMIASINLADGTTINEPNLDGGDSIFTTKNAPTPKILISAINPNAKGKRQEVQPSVD